VAKKWYRRKSLAAVYEKVVEGRNFLYDGAILDSLHLRTPVISIGNLTVGGTGKTPFTQMLLNQFRDQSRSVAVVGRNYRGSLRGTARVQPKEPRAAFVYGDEPTQLALNNPDVPVFVGPQKWRAALMAEADGHPEVILVDDGFQHRALARQLDLLLLDATASRDDYRVLPLGLGREPFGQISRADMVILTKVNFATEAALEALREQIPANLPVAQLAYRLDSPVEETGLRVLGIAGLAQPETFKRSLQQDTLYEVAGFLTFPDHHPYSREDLHHIREIQKSHSADLVVMTEKDYVKLESVMAQYPILDPDSIRVLKLQTYFLEGAGEFHSRVEALFSKGS